MLQTESETWQRTLSHKRVQFVLGYANKTTTSTFSLRNMKYAFGLDYMFGCQKASVPQDLQPAGNMAMSRGD